MVTHTQKCIVAAQVLEDTEALQVAGANDLPVAHAHKAQHQVRARACVARACARVGLRTRRSVRACACARAAPAGSTHERW